VDHSAPFALAVAFGTAGAGFVLTGRFVLALTFLAVSAFSLSLGYLLVRRERRRESGPEVPSNGTA
jgi:drug/metabolite transporter (DMT)-like permease